MVLESSFPETALGDPVHQLFICEVRTDNLESLFINALFAHVDTKGFINIVNSRCVNVIDNVMEEFASRAPEDVLNIETNRFVAKESIREISPASSVKTSLAYPSSALEFNELKEVIGHESEVITKTHEEFSVDEADKTSIIEAEELIISEASHDALNEPEKVFISEDESVIREIVDPKGNEFIISEGDGKTVN